MLLRTRPDTNGALRGVPAASRTLFEKGPPSWEYMQRGEAQKTPEGWGLGTPTVRAANQTQCPCLIIKNFLKTFFLC